MAAATRLVGGACAAFTVAFRQRPEALARLDEQGYRSGSCQLAANMRRRSVKDCAKTLL